MIALYYLLDHAWDPQSIINLLLLRSRFKDLVKLEVSSLLNILRVIIDINDRARDVCDDFLGMSIFMSHQWPHPDSDPDSCWLLLHHYNYIYEIIIKAV